MIEDINPSLAEQEPQPAEPQLILRGGHAFQFLREVVHVDGFDSGPYSGPSFDKLYQDHLESLENQKRFSLKFISEVDGSGRQSYSVELTKDQLKSLFSDLVLPMDPSPDTPYLLRFRVEQPGIWQRNLNPETLELVSLAAQEFRTSVTTVNSAIQNLNSAVDGRRLDKARHRFLSLPGDLRNLYADLQRMKGFLETLKEARNDAIEKAGTNNAQKQALVERNWIRFIQNEVLSGMTPVIAAAAELLKKLENSFSSQPSTEDTSHSGETKKQMELLTYTQADGTVLASDSDEAKAFANNIFNQIDGQRVAVVTTLAVLTETLQALKPS